MFVYNEIILKNGVNRIRRYETLQKKKNNTISK